MKEETDVVVKLHGNIFVFFFDKKLRTMKSNNFSFFFAAGMQNLQTLTRWSRLKMVLCDVKMLNLMA